MGTSVSDAPLGFIQDLSHAASDLAEVTGLSRSSLYGTFGLRVIVKANRDRRLLSDIVSTTLPILD